MNFPSADFKGYSGHSCGGADLRFPRVFPKTYRNNRLLNGILIHLSYMDPSLQIASSRLRRIQHLKYETYLQQM